MRVASVFNVRVVNRRREVHSHVEKSGRLNRFNEQLHFTARLHCDFQIRQPRNEFTRVLVFLCKETD